MPLAPSITTPVFIENFAGNSMLGVSVAQFSRGLADGLFLYASEGITVSTVDVGTFGSSSGSGSCYLSPQVIFTYMQGTFAASQMLGVMSTNLISAISNSLSIVISSASVNTVHYSVGNGIGTGSLVASSAYPIFLESFLSVGMSGSFVSNLASAVGNGLDLALPSASVNVAILGYASPTASTGIGSGKIL